MIGKESNLTKLFFTLIYFYETISPISISTKSNNSWKAWSGGGFMWFFVYLAIKAMFLFHHRSSARFSFCSIIHQIAHKKLHPIHNECTVSSSSIIFFLFCHLIRWFCINFCTFLPGLLVPHRAQMRSAFVISTKKKAWFKPWHLWKWERNRVYS